MTKSQMLDHGRGLPMRYQFLCFVVVLILACQSADSADPKPEPPFMVPAKWVGAWELSPEANKLLGYDSREDRTNAVFDHPESFTLTFDKTLGESVDEENLQAYRDFFRTQMPGHQLVATGAWKMKFEIDPGFEEDGFFLTVKEGATYLWKPAAFVVLYGGKISFLEGVDKSRDLLVIDYNPLGSKSPRHETVVYQGVDPKEESGKPKAVSDSDAFPSERHEAVRKTYRAVPPGILGVKEPIIVLWSSVLFDGGTIFVKAKDAGGKIFHVTLGADETDHKIDSKNELAWVRNYQTHRIQFDFSENINRGPYYPIRGPEEAAIYGLLIRWSEKPKYAGVDEKLWNHQEHWTKLFVKTLDHRFANLPE